MEKVPDSMPADKRVVGRLAPTPSAGLHVGNLFSCLIAWLAAKSAGGEVVLRIEDLDISRCKPEYAHHIMHDLHRLGLTWDNDEVMWQHDRTSAYDAAFAHLKELGLTYPCFCSRADLHAASAPHRGERYLYAGTCRNLSREEIAEKVALRPAAQRMKVPAETWAIDDGIQGPFRQNLANECGDFIIRRSDGVYSYQLAVVVDDLAQGVTEVVRGYDLLDSAPQQEYLRATLQPGAAPLRYAHIPLLLDAQGRRLSKRDHDQTLDGLLERFGTVPRFLGHLAFITGLRTFDAPVTAQELLTDFSLDALKSRTAIIWR